ncbi:MAG: cache domain-containing protein [Acetatifactor sp.]
MKSIKTWIGLVCITFVGCMLLSIVLTMKDTAGVLRDSSEKDHRAVSSLIENAIENSFMRPIVVAETMANDKTVKELLSIEDPDGARNAEDTAAEYLESIRKGFGYNMVFAVSDRSKAYFTGKGITKFIQPGVDPHDIWYKLFVESGKYYDLDVDTDEAANWSLSVFVNTQVRDENNNYIGTCGIGVDMTDLQKLLEKYERIYGVKINLIDETGLIQVDTDEARIERDFIVIDNLEKYSDGERYYETLEDSNRIITYMDELDWYLVVENKKNANTSLYRIIRSGILCLGIGVIVVILLCIVYRNRYTSVKENDTSDDKVLMALANAYMSAHIINLEEDTAYEYVASKEVKNYVNTTTGAVKMMAETMSHLTVDSQMDDVLRFTDLTTLSQRLKSKNTISEEFKGKNVGWFRGSFIVISRDHNGNVKEVLWTTQVLEDQMERDDRF